MGWVIRWIINSRELSGAVIRDTLKPLIKLHVLYLLARQIPHPHPSTIRFQWFACRDVFPLNFSFFVVVE